MFSIKRIFLFLAALSFTIGLATVQAQDTKEEVLAKINKLNAQLKGLNQEMTDASNARNIQEYERLKAEYGVIKAKRDEIKASFKARNRKLASGITAYKNGRKSFGYRNYTEALTYFDKCISIMPDFAKAYSMRALTLKKLNRFEESETAYKKAIELNPDDPKIDSNLGLLYVKLTKYDLAIKSFNTALAKDSTLYKVHYHLGNVYSSQSKIKLAAKAFLTSVTINPRYYIGYRSLGVMYHNQKMYNKAVKAFQNAVKIKATDGRSWYRLTESLNELNRYNETIKAGLKAIQYAKKSLHAPVHLAMGQAYMGLGDKANAKTFFIKAKADSRYRDNAEWFLKKLEKGRP